VRFPPSISLPDFRCPIFAAAKKGALFLAEKSRCENGRHFPAGKFARDNWQKPAGFRHAGGHEV